jgi:hypothetical protein
MQTVMLIIVFILGLSILIGAVLGWEGMYKSRRAKAIVDSFGISGARIIYGIVGILVAAGALLGLFGFFD